MGRMTQPGAEELRDSEDEPRSRVLIIDDITILPRAADRQRAIAVVNAWANGEGPTTDAVGETRSKQQQVLRPHHLYFTVDLRNTITSATTYTGCALGYDVSDMVGADAFSLLHRGEVVVNPDATQARLDAIANPGKHFSYNDTGHLVHADGHFVQCLTTAMTFNGVELAIDVEISEEEIHRVRKLFPHQFADPGEKESFAAWIDARDRRRLRELEAEALRQRQELEALKAERRAEPTKPRKWYDAVKVRQLLREIHQAYGDRALDLTLQQYCDELEARSRTHSHISENTLRDRFVRVFGWGELRAALREMALEDTADQQFEGWAGQMKVTMPATPRHKGHNRPQLRF